MKATVFREEVRLTVPGYQVTHVDTDFYDRFYRSEALTETQHQHMVNWRSGETRTEEKA